MTHELIIREAVPADFEQWLPLWQAYNAFYERVGPTALPMEITQTTWKRFLDPGEPMWALVAERAQRLIGFTHYLFHRSTTLLAPICYLQDLFTSTDARGSGVGGALISAVYERARAAGSSRVYWQTHETNATARRLYDKVSVRSGFIVYRTNV